MLQTTGKRLYDIYAGRTEMRVEQVCDEVVGLRPAYHRSSNSTEIFLDKGQVFTDQRTLKSVVKALARCYAIDLKAQRQLLRDRTGRKAVIPFFLGKERVFIPLKMRRPLARNDATYGYVDVRCLQEVEQEGRRKCWVMLSNGIKLEVFSNRATVIQSLHIGKQLLASLQELERHNGDEGEEIVKSARILARALGKISRQLDRIEKKYEG